MSTRPTIGILHQLAQSGGWLVCRCLGSMPGTAMLHEIHPRATDRFPPLKQARDWYGLVSDEEVHDGHPLPPAQFLDAIALIHSRCNERGWRLALSDWTHLDFTGVPFVPTPGFHFHTAEVLRERFDVTQAVLVRHPLHQLTSLKRLRVMQGHWDEEAIVRGVRRFAEQAARLPCVRFEEFLAEPDRILRTLCSTLGVAFDAGYRERWQQFDKISGGANDARIHPDLAVEPWDEELLARLVANRDYRAALELLGYEHLDLPCEHLVGGEAAGEPFSPADVPRLFEEGNRLCAAKRWEAAVRCYQGVLRREPKHWSALNNIGYCLNQLKKHDWAALEVSTQTLATLSVA